MLLRLTLKAVKELLVIINEKKRWKNKVENVVELEIAFIP
jgi:hypothetical protein